MVSATGYARTIESRGGRIGLINVTPDTRDRLRAEISFPKLDALPTIIAGIRRVFDLAADPTAIAEHLRRDPVLEPLVAARPGLRAPGAWEAFELAVRAILGQQISVVAARTLASHLVTRFAEPAPPELGGDLLGLTHVFPSAARLADADFSDLPMPRARIAALSALARTVAADPAIFGPSTGLEDAVGTA